MVTEKDAKGVIACVKDLPLLPTGERPDEVMERAYEMYKDSKHNDEADYPEFVQVFEQKINEGIAHCGLTKSPQAGGKSEARLAAEATIARLERSAKHLTGGQKEAADATLARLRRAIKYIN